MNRLQAHDPKPEESSFLGLLETKIVMEQDPTAKAL
jgi:hypothetical protein